MAIFQGENLAFKIVLKDNDGNVIDTEAIHNISAKLYNETSLKTYVTYEEFVFDQYYVGEVGPAGGLIFYKDVNYYLEAAPADETGIYTFAASTAAMETNYEIGQGRANTDNILLYQPAAPAAYVCDIKTESGFADWFLPSQEELELMYSELHENSLGSFSDTNYWSSYEHNLKAEKTDFATGISVASNIASEYSVRAIREFMAGSNASTGISIITRESDSSGFLFQLNSTNTALMPPGRYIIQIKYKIADSAFQDSDIYKISIQKGALISILKAI